MNDLADRHTSAAERAGSGRRTLGWPCVRQHGSALPEERGSPARSASEAVAAASTAEVHRGLVIVSFLELNDELHRRVGSVRTRRPDQCRQHVGLQPGAGHGRLRRGEGIRAQPYRGVLVRVSKDQPTRARLVPGRRAIRILRRRRPLGRRGLRLQTPTRSSRPHLTLSTAGTRRRASPSDG